MAAIKKEVRLKLDHRKQALNELKDQKQKVCVNLIAILYCILVFLR